MGSGAVINMSFWKLPILRALFVTRLANGNGVSDEERMASSRHESLSASAIYQEQNSESESNKFAALGIRPPNKKMK